MEMPGYAGVASAMADAYLDAGRRRDAQTILNRLPNILSPVELFDAAIWNAGSGAKSERTITFSGPGKRF